MLRKLFPLLVTLLITGCTQPLPNAGEEIPAHVVINTVRCELARIVTDERYARQTRLLFGEPKDNPQRKQTRLTLGLKIVQSRTTGAGIGVSNILAFGGALSLNFGVSAAYANTVETQFVSVFPKFQADANINRDTACRTKERMGNGIGLETAVLALVDQIKKAETANPKIQSESIKYVVTFGVTSEAKMGADFTFVPVKLSASNLEKREDVQTITFEGILANSEQYLAR